MSVCGFLLLGSLHSLCFANLTLFLRESPFLSYTFKKIEKKYQNTNRNLLKVFRNRFACQIDDEFAKMIFMNTFETLSKLTYSKYQTCNYEEICGLL